MEYYSFLLIDSEFFGNGPNQIGTPPSVFEDDPEFCQREQGIKRLYSHVLIFKGYGLDNQIAQFYQKGASYSLARIPGFHEILESGVSSSKGIIL